MSVIIHLYLVIYRNIPFHAHEILKRALLRLVCKDVFELAAVDEASLDVAGGVGEAHGVAAQGLEPAVDGFGGSVA